jgi:hypothetical protein
VLVPVLAAVALVPARAPEALVQEALPRAAVPEEGAAALVLALAPGALVVALVFALVRAMAAPVPAREPAALRQFVGAEHFLPVAEAGRSAARGPWGAGLRR